MTKRSEMFAPGSSSWANSVCRDCKRTVAMATVNGRLVATETEVVDVIPVRRVPGDGGGLRMDDGVTQARRLHAPICHIYAEQARKEKIAQEKRDYEAAQRRSTRKNHGL